MRTMRAELTGIGEGAIRERAGQEDSRAGLPGLLEGMGCDAESIDQSLWSEHDQS